MKIQKAKFVVNYKSDRGNVVTISATPVQGEDDFVLGTSSLELSLDPKVAKDLKKGSEITVSIS